ncbi:MAG: Uma2 family endonuclease [Lachnospiraceae bacterium]|nr:Uma2 family endonuclease [Lachnospiraceae bacterium]
MEEMKNVSKITLRQYEAMSEDLRVEILDGVAYNMASPSQVHQSLVTELLFELRRYIGENGGKCKVFTAPFDVKLCDEKDEKGLVIVQPDLLIVCDPEKLDGKRCNGAPDFVLEIVSESDPAHDYLTKLNYYSKAKVREYWIVDPLQKTVTVYWFDEESFFCRYFTFNDKVKVNIYDDLAIDFAEIMGRI